MELDRSSEEFPVNLDYVWPLVYVNKNKAVEALKDGFMEEEDYIAKRSDYQRLTQKDLLQCQDEGMTDKRYDVLELLKLLLPRPEQVRTLEE